MIRISLAICCATSRRAVSTSALDFGGRPLEDFCGSLDGKPVQCQQHERLSRLRRERKDTMLQGDVARLRRGKRPHLLTNGSVPKPTEHPIERDARISAQILPIRQRFQRRGNDGVATFLAVGKHSREPAELGGELREVGGVGFQLGPPLDELLPGSLESCASACNVASPPSPRTTAHEGRIGNISDAPKL